MSLGSTSTICSVETEGYSTATLLCVVGTTDTSLPPFLMPMALASDVVIGDGKYRYRVLEQNDRLAAAGLRVLAMARRDLVARQLGRRRRPAAPAPVGAPA